MGADTFTSVRLSDLRPNPYNPRKGLDPTDGEDESTLADLARSIEKDGVIQPIVVRPSDNHGYEVAAGARRWKSSGKAGLKVIPAIVRTLSDEQMRRYAIVENFHRLALGGAELEAALGRIWTEDYKPHGKSKAEMARDLGMPQGTLRDYVDSFEAHQAGLIGDVPDVSAADTSKVASIAKESREAAETLLSAKAEGVLTRDELWDAAVIVRQAPKETRTKIAQELVKEAEAGKKAAKIGFEYAKSEAMDIAKGVTRDRLEIVLGHEERLLNRMASMFSWARKVDLAYLESFQTTFARERAIQVLQRTRDIIDATLQRAQDRRIRERWDKEWEELREEKGLPQVKKSDIPSLDDILKAVKGKGG